MIINIVNRESGLRFRSLLQCFGLAIMAFSSSVYSEPAQYPLFMGGDITAPPLTMLVMGRDHTLYYEAYNDASDLNGDGVLDVGYKPEDVDYFGYFDSNLCYGYTNDRFSPIGNATNKKCSDSWSGDFLNYITTARIDALRKVLYGGRRIIDEGDEGDDCLPDDCLTVLERSYIPQDAHSWGKEYHSPAHDGYEISDYTPLSTPSEGTRHLFANTTLLKSGNMEPRMRVLNDSQFRIWEWVAIENPVAGTNCNNGSNKSCTTASVPIKGTNPSTAEGFQNLITQWGTDTQKCGSGNITNGLINGSGNPYSSVAPCSGGEYYLTTIEGKIYAPTAGDYVFATNGDDAVEVYIDGVLAAYWYNGHAAKTGTATTIVYGSDGIANSVGGIDGDTNPHLIGTVTLEAGWHDLSFHHEEITGGDSYQLLWKPAGGVWATVPALSLRGPLGETGSVPQITTYSMERTVPASTMVDYFVRVEVCNKTYPDAVCKTYPAGTMKPVGVLQRYGENNEMMFGLLTGSYTHPYNTRGGLLRKNIESFQNEINTQTGQFTDLLGIVKTIDRMRVVDFGRGDAYYYVSHETKFPMSTSTKKYPDWGNPIGEMVYETLRYFSGQGKSSTYEFTPSLTNKKEVVPLQHPLNTSLEFPAPDWRDPYYTYTVNAETGVTEGKATDLYCSPGVQLIISDVNPSYDTDQVPGISSAFGSFPGVFPGLNATNEANAIWAEEGRTVSEHFIGQSGTEYDGAPSAKSVTGLGSIRGLSPSEPTKEGGYYTAGIARYAFNNDLRSDIEDKQDINTFAVALASPLPRIEIPVGDSRVTLVPFAKSVKWDSSGIDPTEGKFQPTNTIVDFFIEQFANTAEDGSDADPEINDGLPSIKFRINYEDVEQGADHDMDAIVAYTLEVKDADDDGTEELVVTLSSQYAAGGIVQHMGYVISGTTKDGVYLEVRDVDTSEAGDQSYFLDTRSGLEPGDCAGGSPATACSNPLPLFATRTFEVSGASNVATVLENPLWYAAKYGSEGNEGLARSEASPNYFLVTNAGTLQKQLETAFESMILLGKSSASSISVDSVRIDTDTRAFLAKFDSKDWSGTVIASEVDANGKLSQEVWNTDTVGLPPHADRNIFTFDPGDADRDAAGIAFTWGTLTAAQQDALGADETEQAAVLGWLRGDSTREGSGDTDFRERDYVLGDIVNSNPVYDKGTDTLYVGANDGMLHAFDAADGSETFAYVPNAVFPALANLTSQGYTHRYYVDGSASIAHADDQSILIGTLGAGGRAVFALDVSDPENFAAEDVLWEISDTSQPEDNTAFDGPDYKELGYMVGQMPPTPAIGYWKGQLVAVFGNGFDSGTGATLFVTNALTGALIDKLTVSTDADNGLAGAALVLDSDQQIAGAYAGDLKGNLWKFNLTGNALALASNGAPLFVAQDANGNRQPITAAVNFTKHPEGGNLVVFGTGQYMRTSDPTNLLGQTAYGVWDNAKLKTETDTLAWTGGSTTNRAALLEQEFLYEDVIGERKWRIVSNNTISWATHRGWYVDLISPVDGAQGERINYQAGIIPGSGEAVFTSIVPTASDDPCMAGTAYRWIFMLDSLTGGISDWTRFDVNEDGVFDIDDVKKIADPDDPDADASLVPYIGFTTDFGGSVSTGGSGTDVILLNERKLPGGPPRQSWRQLR
ncbi:pilus assembly protein [Thiocystis violacea]|uniref:pilus assembly protein n=1 Tax=Thiocystis violacea TaxID=13725 RepID=UPI001906C935|nr:PilC/PilY family type IV pilus protein [Thiocystis violacea]MBK1719525.1 hypothetical protein [Thiocystis violacea]